MATNERCQFIEMMIVNHTYPNLERITDGLITLFWEWFYEGRRPPGRG